MVCTTSCKYDALNRADIKARKPGTTCTLCGDCLSACHAGSIKYRFLKLSPEASRKLYLLITITLHAATMALARI
jgi:heterodisulfide reductase subunit A-like polyferredoxin